MWIFMVLQYQICGFQGIWPTKNFQRGQREMRGTILAFVYRIGGRMFASPFPGQKSGGDFAHRITLLCLIVFLIVLNQVGTCPHTVSERYQTKNGGTVGG